ncbi:MAG: hypothetical protein EP346_00070 [Bacteroidetes bacterium]|nr:MAG: hypothetical protein EP346_00070 [Bacteroidota bacterium]
MAKISSYFIITCISALGLFSCSKDSSNSAGTFETVRYRIDCDYCWIQSYEYDKDRLSWNTVNYTNLDSTFDISFIAAEGQTVAGFTVNNTRLVVDSIEDFYRIGANLDSLYVVTDTVINGNDTTYLIGDTLFLNRVVIAEKEQTVVGSIYVDKALVMSDTLTGERLKYSLQ